MSGVAHVAPHGRVGPTHLEGARAQGESDQLFDVIDHMPGIPEGAEPVSGEACAYYLVMMEGHSIGSEDAGGRLSDIVEKGGEAELQPSRGLAHHGHRVGKNVLVLLYRVLLEFERRQFR